MELEVNDSVNVDYNWDDISVGNFQIDHSAHFFHKNHPEHEKFNENLLSAQQNVSIPIENIELNESNSDTKENIESEKNDVFESPNGRQLKKNEATKPMKEFNVIRFAKLYETKKKVKMQMVEQKEREQRQFHSKPAPNFQAIHSAVERKKVQQPPKYTCPETPTVVKRHREAQERVQKKKEEYEASLKPKPFHSNPDPDVLRAKPFVPQHEKVRITPAPFNLQTDTRVKERRAFDEQFRSEYERKQKEKEEHRLREEERIRKELRKLTEFKAHPYRGK